MRLQAQEGNGSSIFTPTLVHFLLKNEVRLNKILEDRTMINNSFTPIPDWILRDQCLSTAELYVYSYMYKGWTYARSKGYEYQISYKKLAEGLNYKTTGAVIRTINKMESLGILTVERSKRADNHDNKNIFRFNEDKVYVNQGLNLETLPNDNSEIEGLKNEELRVSRLTPHTKENKKNKNNNLSTIGPGTGKDILQESEELSFNFSSSSTGNGMPPILHLKDIDTSVPGGTMQINASIRKRLEWIENNTSDRKTMFSWWIDTFKDAASEEHPSIRATFETEISSALGKLVPGGDSEYLMDEFHKYFDAA